MTKKSTKNKNTLIVRGTSKIKVFVTEKIEKIKVKKGIKRELSKIGMGSFTRTLIDPKKIASVHILNFLLFGALLGGLVGVYQHVASSSDYQNASASEFSVPEDTEQAQDQENQVQEAQLEIVLKK